LDERQRIVTDLADKHCLIMRNHGLMTVGESVGAAWCYMYRLERACRMQIEFQKTGAEWVELSQQTIGHTIEKSQSLYEKDSFRPVGTVEWDAVKRSLEREGTNYRT
jgi:ribulose-5-phosphate 4-epimerase/fuculose-1-phosphate aldolase